MRTEISFTEIYITRIVEGRVNDSLWQLEKKEEKKENTIQKKTLTQRVLKPIQITVSD